MPHSIPIRLLDLFMMFFLCQYRILAKCPLVSGCFRALEMNKRKYLQLTKSTNVRDFSISSSQNPIHSGLCNHSTGKHEKPSGNIIRRLTFTRPFNPLSIINGSSGSRILFTVTDLQTCRFKSLGSAYSE